MIISAYYNRLIKSGECGFFNYLGNTITKDARYTHENIQDCHGKSSIQRE